MEYSSLATQLAGALDLKLEPIAVSFDPDLAADAPKTAAAASKVAAGCAFWEQAAQGPILTVAGDHELCSIGVYTHNLANPPANYASELNTVLTVLKQLQYATDEDVAVIPVLKKKPTHVLYTRLAIAGAVPDAVLLFVNAAGSLIVSEAVQQVEGANAPAMGRPACAVIPQVVNSGKAALSLGCCGARAYLSVLSDDVALWALPGASIQKYVDRIAALSSANQILNKFHKLRMEDVQAGLTPSYENSMARLQN